MFDTAKKYLWVIKAISKLGLSTQKEVIKNFLSARKKYVPDDKKADMVDVLKCALCPNMCRFDCPVVQAAKSETYSPAGRSRIAYLMETKQVDPEDAVNIMYACAGCDACKQWCPFGFSVEDLLVGVRKDIVKEGVVPENVTQVKNRLMKTRSFYEEKRKSVGKRVQPADNLYFAGCSALNKRFESVDAVVTIMEKNNIAYGTLKEEWCCGAPLYLLGFEKEFTEFAEHNMGIITENGYNKIVCTCPQCVYMFKEVYPKFGISFDAEILHVSEFWLQLVKKGAITFKEMSTKYVYHDPCILARKLNIIEEPRELLQSIPGLTLKEVYLNKENTHCCGMGGALAVTHPDISLKIAETRSSQLENVSSSVVTGCPTCALAFNRMGLNTIDLSELILKVLK